MIPHIDQFYGAWAMHQAAFSNLQTLVLNLDWSAHLASPQAAAAMNAGLGSAPENRQGIAIIELAGTMMKHQSSLPGSVSTTLVRRQIRAAAASPTVGKIMLLVESGGGTLAGTPELARDIAAAGKIKPVWAYIEDIGASAAYWAASQSSRVIANATALVGSIGTYSVVVDESGKAEKQGVKVHVVKAGALKGMGVPGSVVTDQHLAAMQTIIDQQNAFFVEAVATGRRMPSKRASELADGGVHIAGAAKELKLIDEVGSLESTLAKLAALEVATHHPAPRAAAPPPSDPVADFAAIVRANMNAGQDRQQAIANAARRHPDLHRASVAASARTKFH